ncbi:hypothetical protein [Priestia abyssalis]|uniref:hypothetical protein n=1 Tax=Priestia abyssalis TaxID=1221450 RepID=UPI00099565BD|nr:hypothetical protein [Priestia abyssalis]
MRIAVSICIAALLTGGCNNDKPRPETKVDVVPMNVVEAREEAVETLKTSLKRSMVVRQHVKRRSVYVECIINDFSFSASEQNEQDGKGYIQLYVDGKKLNVVSQAAFIIKNLPAGKHTIKLELMKNQNESYGLSETFEVSV